ncbi:hypothetical protein [Lunatibacter salilacus]|uniref:hypothetical protein n=1 Tax=Lunatibacter salilacus TaxID=2483804 RepID=UPI00131ADA5A|nr:hypothetical protein [Lunatibacter salilacus]HSI77668.1 hypothetical protein [Lunatimonas sp.]
MDIQSSKIELVRLILNIENPKLIARLSEFLKRETQDFWEELSEIEKKEIEIGLKQLDNGERIDFDDFLKKVS